MLLVRDDKLDVRDDEVASPEDAEGRTCVGRTCGQTPSDGIGTKHVEAWNRTSKELGMSH